MTTDNKQSSRSRRRFLKTVAASSGAVALTAGAGGVFAAGRDDSGVEAPGADKAGYRETKHVRDYYAKADF